MLVAPRCVVLGLPGAAMLRLWSSCRRRARLTLLAFLFAGLTRAAFAQTDTVARVVDGDTLVLQATGTVRLIGIDTPETVDPRVPVQAFGAEATEALRQMVGNRQVRLAFDHQRRDKYGRTLAYLYLTDGTFVNLEMVRRGYAHAYLDYPFQQMEQFRAAEREAREAGRGLWGGEPSPTSPRGLLGPTGTLAAGATPAQVWVNTSSRVYHCSGTRYYGNTARGEYLSESDATTRGYRPAYGKSCGGSAPAAKTAQQAVKSSPPVTEPSTAPAVRVWVNTNSRVYHCPGTRYYGNTKAGQFMSESDAKAAGHRPAGGRGCS